MFSHCFQQLCVTTGRGKLVKQATCLVWKSHRNMKKLFYMLTP